MRTRRDTAKIFSALFVFSLALSQPIFSKEKGCCWVDIKTGKKVPSVPDSGINHVSDLQDLLGADKIHDPGIAIVSIDGKTARNTRTGKQYAREQDGCWVDVKTGKQVPSVPDSGINHVSDLQDLKGAGKIHDPGIATVDIDGKTARNTRTGKQYALEDCPPPAPTVAPAPSTTTPPEHASVRTTGQPIVEINPPTPGPLFELGIGYNYIHAPDEDEVKNLHGFNASLFVNVNSWLAFGGEFAAGFGEESFRNLIFEDVDISLDRYLYLFGPRVSLRPAERFRIFAQAMVGGVHDHSEITFTGVGGSVTNSSSADAWAFDFGVGADWRFTDRWSWRIIQADYLATTFSSFNNDHWQDNWRLSTGFVFQFGGPRATTSTTSSYSKESLSDAK